MSFDFEKGYAVHLERQAIYKKMGCDNQVERNFIIDQASPLKGKILDLGCGHGHFSMDLAGRGYDVSALDVSPDSLEIAKWNLNRLELLHKVELYRGSGESLPFSDRSFNAIFSIKVLHHLKDPYPVFDEMIRILSDEGQIVLSDFSEKGFEMVEFVHAQYAEKHPRVGMSISDAKEYFLKSNFSIHHKRTEFQETLIIL